MNLITFKGGIHPPCHKELTENKLTTKMEIPSQVVIPLRQHIGAPNEVKVAEGEKVKTGQVIGESSAFVSASVHASCSGIVKKIGMYPHPVLGGCLAVVIESDGQDTWIEKEEHRNWEQISPLELRKIIKDRGIVGMGGAGFPTHVKLTPPENKPIDTVILNGAECEPYLTADHRVMVERVKDVVLGLKIIMKVLGVKRAYIGIEINKKNALFLMEKAVRSEKRIKVIPLKVKYPQGSEKHLIKTILQKEVPSGKLPMDVKTVVLNVSTALAIKEAVVNGLPLIEREITVIGRPINESKNLRVRLGTLFTEVIKTCGGFVETPARVIMGGPMMGIAQKTLDLPIIKTTCGILALTKEDISLEIPSNCIRCGKCVDACPMKLMPNMLGLLAQRRKLNELREYHLSDCIECGCCAFVCPAKRPLVHYFKLGKYLIAKDDKK
ncbi:electron transport complex subunit RsxC [bacterium]|nr:electron transport complex subunit RsxC [bacterium]